MANRTTAVTFCSYDSATTFGGPFTWMERLFPALRDRGVEATGLFLLHDGQAGETMHRLRTAGFRCESAPSHPSAEERVRWILERIQVDPPDVFVPNLVIAGYHASRWVSRAGIPTVGILHSDDSFYHAIVDRFVCGPRHNRVDTMVCVSRLLETLVQDRAPNGISVRYLPYGVPIPAQREETQGNRLRLAYVGRFEEEQKRISDVARALCRAVAEVPGTEATLFGDGSARPSVEKILQEAGDLPVKWGGRLKSDAVQEALAEYDALVLLSDYEGLPIAVLEAMACGLIPICLRMRSGISELIEDGATGLAVEDRGDSFVAAVRRLQNDSKLRRNLSRNARERIRSEFSLDRCADQWAELLHQLGGKDTKRKVVEVPRRLRLRPPHPAHLGADPRPTPVRDQIRRTLVRSRMFAGRLRRRCGL